jgi:23S rRNA pseudouridine1911/1915/1917 synthase
MSDKFMISATEQQAGCRLDVFLAQSLPQFSRSRIQKLIEKQHVLVNLRAQKPRYVVAAGDQIEVEIPPPEPAQPDAENLPLDIIFEDSDVFVLNKAPGMVVHPGAGTPDGTVVNALLGRGATLSTIGGVYRPGIVHRLDKDTSGLMVVAKNDMAHQALSNALARRELTRTYWAVAMRRFKADRGIVDEAVGRHKSVRTRMAVDGAESREARTRWRVVESFHNFSLVECKLETGRTHQIRVHLAHINPPILGDELYGGKQELAMQLISPTDVALRNSVRMVKRQMLHARELRFVHPGTGEEMQFKADPPNDFSALLDAMKASATA